MVICVHTLHGIRVLNGLFYRNEKIRIQLLQCFLLNGVILGVSV